MTKEDWGRNKEFDKYLLVNEEMLERTDTDYAPWTIIECLDKDYAALKIITTVTDRLEYELEREKAAKEKKPEKPVPGARERFKNGVLSGVDLSKSLTDEEYKRRAEEASEAAFRAPQPRFTGCGSRWLSALRAGTPGEKGGAIKRLTSHLDPRGYRVNPTASPNDIEKVHHYLWRFWNNVPKAGHIAIFDRTWYGRVMVERIEGFCTEAEWKRAYQEINEMESHMANAGAVVLKVLAPHRQG